MNRYIIGSLWDRVNRNGANKNFEYLFEGRQKIDELNIRADVVLTEAQKTNDMNKDVQKQVNDLILHAGESDAEVIQARGNHAVLNERLKDVDKRLSEMPIKPLKYGPLEMPSDFKPDLLCTFYRDNDGIIKHNMDFQGRYRGGTKLYVRLEGDDSSGNGSPNSPYRTMTKAIEVAIAGSADKYEIITNISAFNRDEFIFDQIVTNKTISIISEGSYENSAVQRNSYNLTPGDYSSDWNTETQGFITTISENASLIKKVYGSEVSLKYRKDGAGGIFRVTVDGNNSTATTFSSYTNGQSKTVEETIAYGLDVGYHDVKITFIGPDPKANYGGNPRIMISDDDSFKSSYQDYSQTSKWAKNKTLVSSNVEYTWTSEGSGTHKTARSAARNVIDKENVDYHGVPIPLTNATSVANCKSTANSWYSDGTSVWVHRKDGKKPTMENTVLNIGTNGVRPKVGDDGVIYFENFIFTNWVTAYPLSVTNDSATPRGEVCVNDCILVGGINSSLRGNALAIEGVKDVYSFNVIAAYAQLDGFNYHYTNIAEANKRDCLAVEYNCKAYNLGLEFQGAGSNNASTSHEGASILRVGTVGYRNSGATIIDVNGCYSVLYDCNASQPMLDGIKGNGRAYSFTTENSGREGKTYLINCGATEADTSLVIDTTHKAYIQNFKYDGEIVASGEIELL